MDKYLNNCFSKEINKFKVLNKDEEIELAMEMENGSSEARDSLICHNLKLVVNNAKRYVGLGVEFEDLVSAGCMGLVNAVDSFDYRKGYKLSTIATISIVNEIRDFVNKNSRMIRIPVDKLKMIKEIKSVICEYVEKNGFEPSFDYISNELNIDKKKVINLMNLDKELVSLDVEDKNEVFVYEKIADCGPENKERINLERLKKLIEKKIVNYVDDEKEIIMNRFGLGGLDENSVSKVSKMFGISEYYVRKIESRVVSEVKKMDEYRNLGFCA